MSAEVVDDQSRRSPTAATTIKEPPGAGNHPGAQGATPPESGGELSKIELPSSDEEGWRTERRGGAEQESRGGATNRGRGPPFLQPPKSVLVW